MDARLIVLHRFVEALGVDGDIGSFENRKRLQKAVYLGQLSGVDLGYRYGWYIKGPYSTDLTRDYFALAEAVSAGEQVPADRQLKPEVRDNLSKVMPLFKVPNGVQLALPDWLELVASWHYLQKVSRLDEAKARDLMMKRKPNLVPYIEAANAALARGGYLQ